MLSKISALGLPVQRIEATDGRKLTFPIPEFCELSYKLLHGRRTSPPEVGCYLSHVECARTFLHGDSDFALILEDDVSFEEDFVKTIEMPYLTQQVGIFFDSQPSAMVGNFRSSALRMIDPSPLP